MVFSIAIHTALFVRVQAANFIGGLISICRRRGLKSRPAFILILLSFAGATIYWSAWMASTTIQIRSTLVKNVGMKLSEKFAIANAATGMPELIQSIFSYFVVP